MPPPRTLDEHIDYQGYPPQVAEMLRQEIREAGTEQAIVEGRSVLPHPIDAQAHFDRKEAEAGRRKLGAADADTVKALQDRLSALEKRLSDTSHTDTADTVSAEPPAIDPTEMH